MKKIKLCFCAVIVLTLLLTSCNNVKTTSPNKTTNKINNGSSQASDMRAIFPQSGAVSPEITTMNLDAVAQKGERLAAVSLQGLANRQKPSVYLYLSNNLWLMKFYKDRGYVTKEDKVANVYDLISKHKDSVKGAVVYDPAKEYTMNTATNVAGVEDRIIISPDMIDKIKALGIKDIKDLRDNNFATAYDAYMWEYKEYFPKQRDDALMCMYFSRQHDFSRDYAVEFKIHVFWLPGPKDPGYEPKLEQQIKYMLAHTKANIPVLGFWYSTDDKGQERGIGEFGGVKLGGQYGKYTVVNDWVGNYSYNSGIQVDITKLKQTKVREKKFREYDPKKKYVALIMIDSGDAPCYYQYGLPSYQWNDKKRGQVAMNIGITPTLKYLAPGILQWMYESATENDYFFNSITGLGYSYPLEGYGTLGVKNDKDEVAVSPDQILKDYFQQTELQMNSIDIDMLGLYSHTWSSWSYEKDDAIINKYIAPLNGIKSVIADMGRNDGPTIKNPNRLLDNNLTIHHTLSRWSKEGVGTPSSINADKKAIDFLVNEIKTYGSSTNFVQAMFYSWAYGPRRLVKVKEALESQGYEFVTLNEFDYLYRTANKIAQR